MAINWTFDTSGTDNFIQHNLYGGMGQGDGIDMRIELNRILYGTAWKPAKGHWVVLRRFDSSQRADTYNRYTHEGVDGPAYNYTDLVLRTRRVPVAKRSDSLDVNKAGVAITDSYVYYFEYTVNPKIGYEILELDPSIDHSVSALTVTTSMLSEKLLIKKVHPYRLDGGNIQYWSAIAEIDQMRY